MTARPKEGRGYIGSRTYCGSRVPQHVQNLVIREYCAHNGIVYLLSGTEYTMSNCYMMLEQVVSECTEKRGLVAYSLFMLPEDPSKRHLIYQRILKAGSEFHAAVENLSLTSEADIQRLEDIWCIHTVLPNCLQSL